jgi:hypothetical protein
MKRALAALALGLSLATGSAHAGRACEDAPLPPRAVQNGMALAVATRDALERSGAEVAIVARVGRDLSRYGLKYSHAGFAWRDHPAGRWFVVHELNACGTAVSDLFDEGLGNFFLDDLVDYQALVLIPPAEVQARLSGRLTRDAAAALHEARYNMAAYPFSTRYQNSNQWVLETLGAALGGPEADSRAGAQAWLRAAGYQPTTLMLSALERLGGRMFRANIAFDDHPPERRFAGRVDVVSVESVARFLANRVPGTRSLTIRIANTQGDAR